MGSTFGALEIGKSGLAISMKNMQIAGHNISNVNTPGYTRQRVNSAAKPPAGSSYLIAQIYNKQTGQGVDSGNVQQIRSDYLDQQFRKLNSDYSQGESRTQAMSYLTGLFEELNDSSSLTGSIKDFFAALGKFGEDTSSKEYRTNVQQQAISMTNNFNYVYNEMISLWEDQNNSINTVAQNINSFADQISQLNKSIASFERLGETANDLRDQRNLLLDQLSGLVNITYSLNDANPSMVDVKIGDAVLIEGTTANPITSSQSGPEDPLSGIKPYVLELGTTVLSNNGANAPVTGGALFAHMQMLSGTDADNAGIPYYMNQMNDLVRNIAKNINDIHAQGFTYPDGATASKNGVNFFQVANGADGNPDYTTITAGTFAISDEVRDSIYNIAGSSVEVSLTNPSTQTGNNEIALQLFQALNNNDYYGQLNSTVAHLAINMSTSQKGLDVTESLVKSVDKQRTSISGVSVDEETTNIIMFKQAYSANARYITSLDDMLATLISNTGRVGL